MMLRRFQSRTPQKEKVNTVQEHILRFFQYKLNFSLWPYKPRSQSNQCVLKVVRRRRFIRLCAKLARGPKSLRRQPRKKKNRHVPFVWSSSCFPSHSVWNVCILRGHTDGRRRRVKSKRWHVAERIHRFSRLVAGRHSQSWKGYVMNPACQCRCLTLLLISPFY